MNSWLTSADGISSHTEEETDKFMASVSGVPPRSGDILQHAGPWGNLQQELHAEEWGEAGVATGMPMPRLEQSTRATRPWIELLRNGTFSSETLADLCPASFQIGRDVSLNVASRTVAIQLHGCLL